MLAISNRVLFIAVWQRGYPEITLTLPDSPEGMDTAASFQIRAAFARELGKSCDTNVTWQHMSGELWEESWWQAPEIID